MAGICEAELAFLKPGKKVLLKSFQGSVSAPMDILPASNYWRLIGRKGCVVAIAVDAGQQQRALIAFEGIQDFGLLCVDNSLWVALADLKFVCRY